MRIDIDGVSELGEIVMTEEFQPIAEKVDALLVSMAVTENKAIGALLLWLAVKLSQRDPDCKITPEYKAYLAAKGRCNNSADAVYDYYGGRGIEFRFCSFDDFLSAIGRKPTRNHSIDRIDSDGHYEPGNVRWASKKEQANNRRNSLLVEVNGTKKTLSEWCGHNRSKTEMARSRITRGTHCVQCAIELPKNTKCLHEKTPVDIGVARGQNGWFATVLYR
jgi:hypothetical protein